MRLPYSIVIISGLLNLTIAFKAFAQPEFVWAKRIGLTGTDSGEGVAVDASGNIYSTGYFFGTVDFDPGTGVSTLTSSGRDIFVTKVDADGKFLWAAKIGGPTTASAEDVKAIEVDATGNVYLTGFFTDEVDFDPGTSSVLLNSNSTFFPDIFILKLDTNGNFQWARDVGDNTAQDEATSMDIDVSGNVVVAGRFTLSPTFGTAGTIVSAGNFDAFVTKIDPSGNFLWVRRIGDVSAEGGNAVTVDPSGEVIFTGYFQTTVDFDPGTGVSNMSTAGGLDVFITKLTSSGDFVWARQLGGAFSDFSTDIDTDASGNVITTGYFQNRADLDPHPVDVTELVSSHYDASNYDYNPYISKLTSSGDFIWAKQFDGPGEDQTTGIDVDNTGNIYCTGFFFLTADFDPGADFFPLASQGGTDGFTIKLNSSGNLQWAESLGSTSADVTHDIVINNSNQVITTGSFVGQVDFAPGSCEFKMNSHNASSDYFSLKLSQSSLPVPTITNVSTMSGPAGTVVTIQGTNFNLNPSNNLVYFHDLQAEVTASTAIEITTTVPTGAITGNLMLTIGCHTVNAGSFTVTGPCNISTSERNALIDLYNATNGASWTNKTNWLSADESTWYGVTVTGCRVTELDLSFNQLVGSLPSSFSNLNYLEVLHLEDNTISGGLPAYLFDNLSGLQELHLQYNSMSGFISSSIGNLTELREVQIQNNSFTFNIGMLSTCTNLEVLEVDDNTVADGIPASLGNLAQLKRLSMSSAIEFDSEIPTALGNLTSLEYLDLSVCRLEGLAPDELGNLTALKNLNLSGNHLEGTVDVLLEDLVNLEHLNLADNYFEGSIPVAIDNMVNLEVLDLSNNWFSGLVEINFADLTQLNTLNLSYNYLSGDFPVSLAGLASLYSVDLSDNRFTSIPVINAYDLFVEENLLDFGDLEPNINVSVNFNYSPQHTLPGGTLISFTVGGTLTIPFSTPGADNFYQWFKVTDPIAGATAPTFILPTTTAADAGLYYVEVTSGVVPGLTLKFEPFLAVDNSCGSVTPTAGDLDLSFVPENGNPVVSIALQSTGKIIAALHTGTGGGGYEYYDIVRFNSDGTTDNTFTTFEHDWGGSSSKLITYPDDWILNYYPRVFSEGEQIFNLEPDGLGSSIRLYPDLSDNIIYYITAADIQADNKIIVSGSWGSDARELTRFEEYDDGAGFVGYRADDTFVPPPELTEGVVNVLKVQLDQNILVGGSFTDGITRLDPTGAVDPTFVTHINGAVADILLQPDGKIIVTGNFTQVNGTDRNRIARLNADGTNDNSFNVTGITDLPEDIDFVNKMALMSNGQIIAAGSFYSHVGSNRKNLARLNADGTLDCSFDPGSSTDEPIEDMVLQPDNKILIVGDFESYNGVARNGFARVNNMSGITIDFHPQNETECDGGLATFTAVASGTTNIQYHWQFSTDGVAPYADISNGGGYTNVNDLTVQVNTTGGFGEGFYRCRISGDLISDVFTNPAQLIITSVPTPTAADITICQGDPITITASGGIDGNYRWQDSDGNLISGAVNSVFTSDGTDFGPPYEVWLVDGSCQGIHLTVNVTILAAPTAPSVSGVTTCTGGSATLTASGGTNGQYRWYAGPTGSSLATSSTSNTFTIPSISSTTSYFVAINDGSCESARTVVTVTVAGICNAPPVIATIEITVPVQGNTSIDLLQLLSDPNDDLDLSTLAIVAQPSSGAIASLDGTNLLIDYTGVSFSGTDALRISICDLASACAEQELTIEVVGEVTVFNALSPNGDGKNDIFKLEFIDVLESTKKNKVTIYNRWGDVVWEGTNYNNTTVVFEGTNNNGKELPSGTYFYKIDYSGQQSLTGYLSLKR